MEIKIKEGSLIKSPFSEKIKAGCVILKAKCCIGEHETKDKEELLIILEGKVQIGVESNKFNVSADKAFYIGPNKKHNVCNIGEEVAKYIYITSPTL